MIETLALETFKHLLPPNMPFKTKFLLAFLVTNTLLILVTLLAFKVFGWLKVRERDKNHIMGHASQHQEG